MAEPKTKPTDADVDDFLAAVPHAGRRADAIAVDAMLREATGSAPVVWGTSMVGYGEREQLDGRGRAASWPVVAFAPRRSELVLYLHQDLDDAEFDGLGPHRRGVGCLYVKRLEALDPAVLRRLVARSVELAQR